MTLLLRVSALLAFVYVVFCALLYFRQRDMLFPAPASAGVIDDRPVPGTSCIAVELAGGSFGAYAPATGEGAPTVVLFHGNGEDVSQQGALARSITQAGFGFFAIEYPGYGPLGDRSPSEEGVYAAAQAGLAWLAGAGVPDSEVVLVGRSLGCAPAIEMAERGHGSALVLVSPFTSTVAMASRVAPFVPAALLVRDRFDNLSKAPLVTQPVTVLHGDQDEVIPIAHGRALAEALPNAQFRALLGVGHNDVPVTRLVPAAVAEVAAR